MIQLYECANSANSAVGDCKLRYRFHPVTGCGCAVSQTVACGHLGSGDGLACWPTKQAHMQNWMNADWCI